MILVAGGAGDPNIVALRERLEQRAVAHLCVVGGDPHWPRLRWQLDDDRLAIDGRGVHPEAVFLRFDVFAEARDRRPDSRRRASEWYYAVLAWALAHTDVALLNRRFGARHLVKPQVLVRARAVGLDVPRTIVANDPAALAGLHADQWIVKPVDGGAHTESLRAICAHRAKLETFTRSPMILQQRLIVPDLRVFRVGPVWLAFELRGDDLDYRAGARPHLERVSPDPALTERLQALTDEFGLDFVAADFKRCPQTGAFRFLEINSAPMFAGFDHHAEWAISDALIDRLIRSAH